MQIAVHFIFADALYHPPPPLAHPAAERRRPHVFRQKAREDRQGDGVDREHRRDDLEIDDGIVTRYGGGKVGGRVERCVVVSAPSTAEW